MKKNLICFVAPLIVILAFGWTILAHAGDLPSISLTTASSAVARVAGDANGDGSADVRDIVQILRALAGGWNVTINESASDVNGDGAVTLKDVTLLRRYLAGGWGVTLL